MTSPNKEEFEVFRNARKIADVGGRREYLDCACGGDRSLRTRIDALLAADEANRAASNFLDHDAGSLESEQLREGPGTVIGRYQILGKLGEGGFGTVYEAEQREPIARRVALKIIKIGMDTRSVIARFEAERQTLALMDHPHIAKVYDAGVTETGRPFFVMELVAGEPIVQYADRKKLSIDARLTLFRLVCRAVHHAHQRGFIHRDLKPSNILVKEEDGRPVPRVIDFGVAKPTSQRRRDTVISSQGLIVGTPEYMSPEQAQFGDVEIDTRSDVYVLGILLFELLTGTTPIEFERLQGRPIVDLYVMLANEEAPSTSLRISSLSNTKCEQIASCRSMTCASLHESLRGELDWIAMRSLEQMPDRRYDTAAAIADDVDRYLENQPVDAGPHSTIYRLRKLLRRHWVAASLMAAVVGGLAIAVCGLTFSTLIASRALRAEAAARSRLELSIGDLGKTLGLLTTFASNASDDLQAQKVARDTLQDIVEIFDEMLVRSGTLSPNLSLLAAENLARFAAIRNSHGEAVPLELYERALAILAKLVEEFPTELDYRQKLSRQHFEVGWRLYYDCRVKKSVDYMQRAIAGFKKLTYSSPEAEAAKKQLLMSHVFIMTPLWTLGKRMECESHFIEGELLAKELIEKYGKDNTTYAGLYLARSGQLRQAGEFESCRKLLRKTEDLLSESNTDLVENWQLRKCFESAARLEFAMGDYQQAADRMRACSEQAAGAKNDEERSYDFDLGLYKSIIGRCEWELGRAAVAEDWLRQSVEHQAAYMEHLNKRDNDSPGWRCALGMCEMNYGNILWWNAKQAKAKKAFEKARQALEAAHEQQPHTPRFANALSAFLSTCPEPSIRDPDRAVQIAEVMHQNSPGGSLQPLGVAQLRAGKFRDAQQSLSDECRSRNKGDAIDWLFLAFADWKLYDRDKARAGLAAAEAAIRRHDPVNYITLNHWSQVLDILAEVRELTQADESDTTVVKDSG